MKNQLQELDEKVAEAFPFVNRWLMYLSVTFLLIGFFVPPLAGIIIRLFACTPSSVASGFLWQTLTYSVLHGSFWHLAVNLLGLYFFANRLEYRYDTVRYFKFVLFAVGLSALLHIGGSYLFVMLTASPRILSIPMVGMSGLVFAAMMLATLHDPDAKIFVFPFPVEIPLRLYVIIIGVLTLLSIPRTDGIAHLAHLGGLIAGWLFYKNPYMLDKVWLPGLGSRKSRGPQVHHGGRGTWRKL